MICKRVDFINHGYPQTHSKKKKKEKKEKREKKEKKKSKNKLRAEGYEETGGITTPSKERVSPTQLDTPISAKVIKKFQRAW